MDKVLIEIFSRMLSYPIQKWDTQITEWANILQKFPGISALSVLEVEQYFLKHDLETLQEEYVQIFDIQSTNHLYAGYAIMGEDLRRGMLLSELKREMNEYSIDLQDELPDHLSLLLRLASVHNDEDLITDLCSYLILPALNKMHKSFEPTDHVYFKILVLLKEYLSVCYSQKKQIYASNQNIKL